MIKMKFKEGSIRKFEQSLEEAVQAFTFGGLRGIDEITSKLLEESQPYVPVETMALKSSGHIVEATKVGDSIIGAIAYGDINPNPIHGRFPAHLTRDYALWAHERAYPNRYKKEQKRIGVLAQRDPAAPNPNRFLLRTLDNTDLDAHLDILGTAVQEELSIWMR